MVGAAGITKRFYRYWPCNLEPDVTDSPGSTILKALGDNTRYAIYLELARSPLPLSTADIADVARRCTPTPSGPTSSGCAMSVCSMCGPTAGRGRPAAAPVLPGR